MNTPWGKSDSRTKIQRGVSWVGTPSHGGLAVTNKAAKQFLSEKARSFGTDHAYVEEAPYYFFEEDCAYAIAFYEHPGWLRVMTAKDFDYWQSDAAVQNLLMNGASPESARATADKEYKRLAAELAKTDDEVRHEMGLIVLRWFPTYFGGAQ